MRRLRAMAVGALIGALGILGCRGRGAGPAPALVVADASPTELQAVVEERAHTFETSTRRTVRILRMPTAAAALEVASRGDAEVAIVPDGTKLDAFVAAGHGRTAGTLAAGAARALVIEVNAFQHPKIDAAGAQALSAALAASR